MLALAQAPSPDTCFSHPCSYFSFLLLLNLTHLLNLIINKSQQRVHLKQHNSWANCLNSTQLIHLWPIIPSIFYLDYPVSQPSWAAFSWPLHMAAMPLCPSLFSGLVGLLFSTLCSFLLFPVPSPGILKSCLWLPCPAIGYQHLYLPIRISWGQLSRYLCKQFWGPK